MFFSQGIDIVDNERIKKNYLKYGNHFLNKFLTRKEIQHISKKRLNLFSRIANRFAAKEATIKAIGTGFRNGITFKNIEILNDKNGKPLIICDEKILNHLKKIDINIDNSKFYLSISDEKKYSVAIVSILNF